MRKLQHGLDEQKSFLLTSSQKCLSSTLAGYSNGKGQRREAPCGGPAVSAHRSPQMGAPAERFLSIPRPSWWPLFEMAIVPSWPPPDRHLARKAGCSRLLHLTEPQHSPCGSWELPQEPSPHPCYISFALSCLRADFFLQGSAAVCTVACAGATTNAEFQKSCK